MLKQHLQHTTSFRKEMCLARIEVLMQQIPGQKLQVHGILSRSPWIFCHAQLELEASTTWRCGLLPQASTLSLRLTSTCCYAKRQRKSQLFSDSDQGWRTRCVKRHAGTLSEFISGKMKQNLPIFCFGASCHPLCEPSNSCNSWIDWMWLRWLRLKLQSPLVCPSRTASAPTAGSTSFQDGWCDWVTWGQDWRFIIPSFQQKAPEISEMILTLGLNLLHSSHEAMSPALGKLFHSFLSKPTKTPMLAGLAWATGGGFSTSAPLQWTRGLQWAFMPSPAALLQHLLCPASALQRNVGNLQDRVTNLWSFKLSPHVTFRIATHKAGFHVVVEMLFSCRMIWASTVCKTCALHLERSCQFQIWN